MTHFFHIDDLARERAGRGKLYFEFLRVPAMSAGVYVLAAGARDPQKPHREDEMYYVVRGRARMQIGSGDACEHAEVRAGSVIFVEAEREHRFYDITEELEVLVFFAPAEQA
jgi:mannose-6-phosphate isomerase-like protein (cupin superfamily)